MSDLYDGDDIDRIVHEFVAYEQERKRVKADAAYFLAEIRRDFTAAEITRLLHQPVLPDMEAPDDRAVRRLNELAEVDPAVLVQVAIYAVWHGGPSATQQAEHELIELNSLEALMDTPPGYVGRRRAKDDA